MLVTLLFIEEEWLSLLKLLKEVYQDNFVLRNHCRYIKIHFINTTLPEKVIENWRSMIFYLWNVFGLTSFFVDI